ncbi:MAG: glutamate--tRNA ligase [Gammaproteobacteria bacterium]
MTIRTRFAPSPTGYLHIGGARTALFSWAYARKQGGKFILRIEDTDRERSTMASVDAILGSLAWLDLDYDEGPHYQGQRGDRYREGSQKLLDAGHAYHCYCTREELEAVRAAQLESRQKPRYDGRCRDYQGPPRPGVQPVVRFKNPLAGETVVNDLVHGRVTFSNGELDDLIIVRADGSPTYNFTVVVDDMDMDITHVIRGDDHLNNTPRQINILRALGAELPQYAHVPMILGSDGKRLSKRHGAVSVLQYRDDGYLPHALVNYLVRLGWSHGDQEIFSRTELIELFDIQQVHRAAATFNPDKLLWLNQHYIKDSGAEMVLPHLREQMLRLDIPLENGPELELVWDAQRERARTLTELAENSRFFYADFKDYDAKAADKHLSAEAAELLEALAAVLDGLEAWQAPAIHNVIAGLVDERGLKLGKVAQPLRVAVSGGAVSPPIDSTLELVGKSRALARIRCAIDFIRARPHGA